MTKTKHSLLMSAIALLLCFSMLIGTTFAWFTDTVTSSGNKIHSGTLKVDLELLGTDNTTWTSLKTSTTPIFNYLNWEPGYTDVKILKIENEGSLALKWVAQFTSEKALSKLADVIDVYVTTEKLEKYPDDRDVVEKWKNVGTVRDFVNTIEQTTNGTLTAKGTEGDTAYLGIALKMREEADNDYQDLDLGGAFDIRIFATQLASEEDSFDEKYDEDAAFSVWNGKVPTEMPTTLVVDGTTQTIHVKDAAAFAYLSTLTDKWDDLYTDGNGRSYTNYANAAGANYYYSSLWTISLEADIDLANYAIEPVKLVIGESTGASTFKGNGHTIRNINTKTGLFADKNLVTYAELTLENVKATNGALTGSADYSITNVTVKDATISGTDYVGGIVGYSYGEVNSCKVFDSSIIATGKEAGGLIGYVVTSADVAHVSSNLVKNVSVYANNRAAGLVAQPNVKVLVYNNTIDNVTVGAADTEKYKPGAVVSNALDPKNVYDNTVINANVADDTTKIAVVANSTDLNTALNSDATTVIVAPGTYTFPANSLKEGVTLECAPDTVFDGKTSLNINGATVVGGTFTNDNNYLVNYNTINGTFKDCVFTNCDGLRYCYAGETVVFENCIFDTDFYGVHFDGGANDVIFKNCNFTGFNTFGSAVTKLTLEGCTFKYNGNGGYNGINMWGNTDMTDCTFVFDGSAGTEWVDLCGDNKTVTFTNCVVTDGKTEKGIETVVCDYGTGNTITVDGTPVVFFNDNLKTAVANGATKIMLREGEYDLNGNQKDGLTFIGLEDGVKVANTTKYASGNAEGAIWKAINVENVTITNTVYTMADGGNATFKNVYFEAGVRQAYGKNVKFDECKFGSNSEGYALHFQSDSSSEGGNITIKDCEFLGGKVHLGGKRAYTFTNCDFATNTDFQVWSNITLDGCTVNGEKVTDANITSMFPNLNIDKVTIK